MNVKHPVTPDGRYFVVRGRLWRMSNPHLGENERSALTKRLMSARRAVQAAKALKDPEAEAAAHRAVDGAKRALGERGPVWWKDGSPDLNRHLAKNTIYAEWYAGLAQADEQAGRSAEGQAAGLPPRTSQILPDEQCGNGRREARTWPEVRH